MDFVYLAGIALLWGATVLLVLGFEKLAAAQGGRS
jgi:hypothetical protein